MSYWNNSISIIVMFVFIPIVWFKKMWDYLRPVSDSDPSIVVPPRQRLLRGLYEFSFDIMSNAVWRTILYVLVVGILVNASLLHLVGLPHQNTLIELFTIFFSILPAQIECSCSDYELNANDPTGMRFYPTCVNSWVMSVN